jgi:hypothetical protein
MIVRLWVPKRNYCQNGVPAQGEVAIWPWWWHGPYFFSSVVMPQVVARVAGNEYEDTSKGGSSVESHQIDSGGSGST